MTPPMTDHDRDDAIIRLQQEIIRLKADIATLQTDMSAVIVDMRETARALDGRISTLNAKL